MFVEANQSLSFPRLPYLFSLGLAGGSLIIYLVGALVARFSFGQEGKTDKTFNLGIPLMNMGSANLFAVSLAAAQTTFSTVFVVFLADAGSLGFHFLYCPMAFAVGNWLMLLMYQRLDQQGYLDDSSLSGLVPYFIYRMTRSPLVTYLGVAICVVPIIALLALELHYGSAYLDYLVWNALGPGTYEAATGYSHALPSFFFFVFFMTFLLGYVFVGGFRAVIASDVWQYRIMFTALVITCVSVLVALICRWGDITWNNLPRPDNKLLTEFYVTITLINLFQPLCFATTWQRFRAFRNRPTDFASAVKHATIRVFCLWTMLIFIGVGIQLLAPAAYSHENVADFLNRFSGLGPWFQLCVFPLLIMAGFSAMYSSSDTWISALLYLTESDRAWRHPHQLVEIQLRRHYYWVMAGLFAMTLTIYTYSRETPQRPTEIAVMLFSNAVILAPTVLLLGWIGPLERTDKTGRSPGGYVLVSLIGGLAVYWYMALSGLELKHWALIGGLSASAMPVCLLLIRKVGAKAETVEATRG
jgi:hypothetical protein